VEFQFYVMWALAIYFITRGRSPNLKLLLALAVTVAIASAAWRITGWLGSSNLNRPYAGTDTRLDALFLGAAAALYRLLRLGDPDPRRRTPWNAGIIRGLEFFFVLGVSWIIGRMMIRNSALYLSGFAFVGAAASGLILTTLLSPSSALAPTLQNKILVWFGRLSYSLYLWHVPVAKFMKPERLTKWGLSPWLAEGFRALLCIVVAAVSYYGVERWFLRLKDRKRHPIDVVPV
jgi:peptidoglycan/LPS O-acetylase OafA/YrhL